MKTIKDTKFKISASFFNLLAVIILVGAILIYNIYDTTQEHIKEVSIQDQVSYVDEITTNIANTILEETKNHIHSALSSNEKLQKNLEFNLQNLITKNYRYIYVVDKTNIDAKEYRFLLDGAKNEDDRSEFEEPYIPENISKWDEAYKNKKTLYFHHKDNKNLWITYLKPIILNNKTQAMIVIDFSLHQSNVIVSELKSIKYIFTLLVLFGVVVFVIILTFSYFDSKREREKKKLHEKEKQYMKEIELFNKTLQEKVKQAVDENTKKEKLLQQQSRLAQMGEMISMIAHQWRQPLSAINSTIMAIGIKVSLGKFDLETKAGVDECLDFISKKHDNVIGYIKILSETIDDFRNFFKPDKEKEKVSINYSIQRALKIVSASMGSKGITIQEDFKTHKELEIYSNELMQVVLNILKNAEDNFSEKQISNANITIKTYEENGSVVVEICDNGGGIPKDILPNIFNPYFSTKNEKNGTGLGLYMSKIIIEEHHEGTLEAYSHDDGVCFRITIS